VIICAFLSALFFSRYLRQLTPTLFLFDVMGLGLSTIIGLVRALDKGFGVGSCSAFGTSTACCGGVLRAVVLNHVPLLFRKEIYAMACIAGGILYFIFKYFRLDHDVSRIICIAAIFTIRVLAFRLKWSLPVFYHKKTEI